MCSFIIISIFLNLLTYSNAVYLGDQANYNKPGLKRNNILNKGLWMKDKVQKSNYGDFIFRTNSGDSDNLLQNNFDAFGENYMDNIPVFSSYVERNKRSIIHKKKHRIKKSIIKCKDNMNCLKKVDDEQLLHKSKFMSQLTPASVLNDYPYEVAVLLSNTNKRNININDKIGDEVDHITEFDKNVKDNFTLYKLKDENKINQTAFDPLGETVTLSHNKNVSSIPKRRKTQSEFELERKEKKSVVEINNKTKYVDGNKISRNVFDKEDKIWQSAPVQNMVIPRPETSLKNKPITEKGLVKVLSLLTKTFRKVMKQHNEIQEIDIKLHSLNEDFLKNAAVLDTKFQEFDKKYAYFVEINEKMQHLNEKFTKKNYDIEHRETEMSNNFKEFENQQKKFLSQQHQFYRIQKFMLDQNEKINHKQNLIARTQSEISRRQNNFARVLKKAKQFYTDKKLLMNSRLNLNINKPKELTVIKVDKPNNDSFSISTTPVSTDSVKINLFSIPKVGPLVNHDKLILEEKNDQSVDELVYKYYFNNTFIDNLMKSKVLTATVDNEGKNTRNTKNKRNDLTNETTILFPAGNINGFPISQNLHRYRRWIKRPNKIMGKNHGKRTAINEKTRRDIKDSNKSKKIDGDKKESNDPYLTMATNFCTEVGQNLHEQMLNWCVEKSLRKLKSIDMTPVKPFASPSTDDTSEKVFRLRETSKLYPTKTLNHVKEAMYTENLHVISTPAKLKSSSENAPEAMYTENLHVISTPANLKSSSENAFNAEKPPDLYFPDNDELELNVEQYELKPDPEGTVYFDGSLHTSDIAISDSDALSDIMPGLDSNSHVDVDPLALDLQARRRAYVRRLNENILKTMDS